MKKEHHIEIPIDSDEAECLMYGTTKFSWRFTSEHGDIIHVVIRAQTEEDNS